MFLLVLSGCQGPTAPDPALCRDVIHRLCIPQVCAPIEPLFTAGTCESTLQTRSGCSSEEFAFTTPTRDRFLNCRLMLLRAGGNSEDHPNCDDVAQLFDQCPDVARFLQGIK